MTRRFEMVMRTWKRDSSINMMSIEAAIYNLADFSQEAEDGNLAPSDIAVALRQGRVFKTKHAEFRMVGSNY